MIELNIDAETWRDLKERVEEYAGLNFTDEYLKALLSKHQSVLGDIQEFGSDTETGGRLLSLISEDLLGRSWPDNREGAGDEFFEQLREKAEERGVIAEKPDDDETGELQFVCGLSRIAASYINLEPEQDHTKGDIEYFIRKNWLTLARRAWKGYEDEGRGVWLVRIPCPLDEFRDGTLKEGFIATAAYEGERGSFFAQNQKLLSEVRYVLDQYDPESSIVLAIVDPEGKCVLQLSSGQPFPKQAATVSEDQMAISEMFERLKEAARQTK